MDLPDGGAPATGDGDAPMLPPLLAALSDVLGHRPRPATPSRPSSRKAAGVLVPFFHRASRLHILFIRRTDRVPTHKGQVAFPGGAAEPEDTDLLATALREAQEE